MYVTDMYTMVYLALHAACHLQCGQLQQVQEPLSRGYESTGQVNIQTYLVGGANAQM